MTGSVYAAGAHCWSGLLSGDKFPWQKGLREVCKAVGGVQFHPSQSGYAGWKESADAAIRRGAKSLLLIGHSNGVFAITSIAERVKPAGIACYLIAFDQTAKRCPAVGGNVKAFVEFWAGLDRVATAADFKGVAERHAFESDSHIGVIGNREAQRLAVAFAARWRNEWRRA